MGKKLGGFMPSRGQDNMTVTWYGPDDESGETTEQGVTAPLDIWIGQILAVLNVAQRATVIDAVVEMTNEENTRLYEQEEANARESWLAEHGDMRGYITNS